MVWNGAQFHMLVNHLPVIGFVGMVLALAVAVTVQSLDIKRFVLVATALVGLSALAPFLTGESAEEVIEHEPGVSESLIHEHEELAEIATVLSVITGVAAAAAFVLQRSRPDTLRLTVPVVLLLSVISSGLMGAAAHEGGKIRHPEIRTDADGAMPGETENESPGD
jgi:hypothetical protein